MGSSGTGRHRDGEVFDPEARTWQPLPPMAHARDCCRHGVVAVAGGLVAVGGDNDADDDAYDDVPSELFDET